MNATFNLKRFCLLEQYKKRETYKHLLWSAAVVLGICLLCMMYDINRGISYYAEHTQAISFSHYILCFLCVAPCLLEANISKHSSTLYWLLPASVFEKFLHLWIKYLLILPLFCTLLIIVIKGMFILSGIDYLQHFGNHIKLYPIRNDQILAFSLLQGIFFIGCIAFKRQKLMKSFIVLCCCFIIFFGIVAFVGLWEPAGNHGYWVANIAYPEYNFPISSTAQRIIAFCNYATPALFSIGIWISAYFMLKEKQL